MDKKIIQKIHKKYIKKLKYLDVPHKKFVICFSGIAGSGKTYIAKILEKRYKAVRIRSDDIRGIVDKLRIKEIDKLTYGYLGWLYNNYSFKNKLIILDKGIDRKYKETFSIFRKKRYKIFIIRLKVSRKLSEKRIIKKLGKPDENYVNNIDRWIKEWEDFGKKIKSDIVIENKDGVNLNPLFSKMDKLIK